MTVEAQRVLRGNRAFNGRDGIGIGPPNSSEILTDVTYSYLNVSAESMRIARRAGT